MKLLKPVENVHKPLVYMCANKFCPVSILKSWFNYFFPVSILKYWQTWNIVVLTFGFTNFVHATDLVSFCCSISQQWCCISLLFAKSRTVWESGAIIRPLWFAVPNYAQKSHFCGTVLYSGRHYNQICWKLSKYCSEIGPAKIYSFRVSLPR